MGFITDDLDAIAEVLGKAPPSELMAPPEGFALSAAHRGDFEALRRRAKEGRLPDLMDFSPTFGQDLSFCENLAPDAFALANDGAGNYFVLLPGGTVDMWCHDEGGYMEEFDFSSLDEVVECVVLATAAKRRALPWESMSERFEAMAARSGGWEFFKEDVEEYLED